MQPKKHLNESRGELDLQRFDELVADLRRYVFSALNIEPSFSHEDVKVVAKAVEVAFAEALLAVHDVGPWPSSQGYAAVLTLRHIAQACKAKESMDPEVVHKLLDDILEECEPFLNDESNQP